MASPTFHANPHLFKELQGRFEEVSASDIMDVMKQCGNNKQRCHEMLTSLSDRCLYSNDGDRGFAVDSRGRHTSGGSAGSSSSQERRSSAGSQGLSQLTAGPSGYKSQHLTYIQNPQTPSSRPYSAGSQTASDTTPPPVPPPTYRSAYQSSGSSTPSRTTEFQTHTGKKITVNITNTGRQTQATTQRAPEWVREQPTLPVTSYQPPTEPQYPPQQQQTPTNRQEAWGPRPQHPTHFHQGFPSAGASSLHTPSPSSSYPRSPSSAGSHSSMAQSPGNYPTQSPNSYYPLHPTRVPSINPVGDPTSQYMQDPSYDPQRSAAAAESRLTYYFTTQAQHQPPHQQQPVGSSPTSYQPQTPPHHYQQQQQQQPPNSSPQQSYYSSQVNIQVNNRGGGLPGTPASGGGVYPGYTPGSSGHSHPYVPGSSGGLSYTPGASQSGLAYTSGSYSTGSMSHTPCPAAGLSHMTGSTPTAGFRYPPVAGATGHYPSYYPRLQLQHSTSSASSASTAGTPPSGNVPNYNRQFSQQAYGSVYQQQQQRSGYMSTSYPPPDLLTGDDSGMARVSQRPLHPMSAVGGGDGGGGSQPGSIVSLLPGGEGGDIRGRSGSVEDVQYIQALLQYQRAQRDSVLEELQSADRHLTFLKSGVVNVDQRLLRRRESRPATVTAHEMQKIREENTRLKTEIHLLTRQIESIDTNSKLGWTDEQSHSSTLQPSTTATSFYHNLSGGQSGSLTRQDVETLRQLMEAPQQPPPRPAPPVVPPPQPRLDPVPPPYQPPNTVAVPAEGTWACQSCTFLNHNLLENCEMCEMPRRCGPPPSYMYPHYDMVDGTTS